MPQFANQLNQMILAQLYAASFRAAIMNLINENERYVGTGFPGVSKFLKFSLTFSSGKTNFYFVLRIFAHIK